MQIPVSFDVKGKAVRGIIHIPKSRIDSSPIIIMCYGINGNRVEQHRMSYLFGKEAEKRGICFFRFDYRGQGISDGEFYDVSMESRKEDVLESINFIKGCFHDENIKFALIGFSDGARIATGISVLTDQISSMVMWNPILSSNKIFNSTIKGVNNKSRFFREPLSGKIVTSFYGLYLDNNYMREIKEDNSLDNFINYKGSKFCIFGSDDKLTVDLRKYIELYLIENNKKDNIMIIKDARHLFGTTDWSNCVIDETLKWIVKN